jgi:hypothetical protein
MTGEEIRPDKNRPWVLPTTGPKKFSEVLIPVFTESFAHHLPDFTPCPWGPASLGGEFYDVL